MKTLTLSLMHLRSSSCIFLLEGYHFISECQSSIHL